MDDHRSPRASQLDILDRPFTRRSLLKRLGVLSVAAPTFAGLLAACETAADDEDVAAEPDDAEEELEDLEDDDDEVDPEDLEDLDDEDVVPEDAEVDLDEIPDVPRERTLFVRYAGQEGRFVEHDLWNAYAVGASHQLGSGLIYEPLAYYSAFADETYPWLAEGWEYNDDSTQLTINLRSGIEWSDGEPFTADDVAFTLNHLVDIGSEVRWGTDVQQFVEQAEAIDETTVVIDFNVPAPRFMYFMTYKFDIGLYIIPRHIFEGEDWATFTAFDLAEGLPLTTGPWQVAHSAPEQKVIDRRDSWWAVDQGLVDELPRVERIVYLPFGDETGTAQQMITNQLDWARSMGPHTVRRIMEENPDVITHTYDEPPYGYVDWWPTALFVNHDESPFDEVDVRWAISYFIDRDQMVEVAYDGAGSSYPLPMPSYPGLDPFVQSVSDILEEYDTLAYDPERGQELMQQAGFELNDDGWWERDGEVLGFTINASVAFTDIGPIVSEMLRLNGIEAEFAQPPDWGDMLAQGNYRAGFQGHGGSVSDDPYDTLRLFQSRTDAIPGASVVNFTRWENAEYDAIVDELATTPLDDQDRLMELFREAMSIWIPELPNIQIQEFYHRIPMNQTYWTNWPTEDNAYVNGSFYHLTFQLILNELEPVQ